MTDRDLEDKIDAAYMRFEALAQSRRDARGRERQQLTPLLDEAWDELQALVKQRSAARVADMARERGLTS